MSETVSIKIRIDGKDGFTSVKVDVADLNKAINLAALDSMIILRQSLTPRMMSSSWNGTELRCRSREQLNIWRNMGTSLRMTFKVKPSSFTR